MIRAVTFDKQMLKSGDFAHQVNYFYQGKMGVSKGCEMSTDVDGNIVIADGYFSIYGRLLRNVGNTIVDVPVVASGSLHSILVFEIDLSQENTIDIFNQGTFKFLTDAYAWPALTEEDLDNGGTIYQLEFCRIESTVEGMVSLLDTRTILSLQMYAFGDDLVAHKAESAVKHITESGSNTNGDYIKFDDGTMMCTGSVGVDVSIATPQVYPLPATYAQDYPFSGMNQITDTTVATRVSAITTARIRATQTEVTVYLSETTTQYVVNVRFFTFGRWKL